MTARLVEGEERGRGRKEAKKKVKRRKERVKRFGSRK